MRRFWAQFRGGLLLLAIVLAGVDGCPIPPSGKERKWQKPVTSVIRPVQQTILKPFKFVTKWGRFHQRWALFQAVGEKQWRMEIAGRTPDGQWHILYRANDDRYTEHKDMLEYRKLRAAWNPTDNMAGYGKFASWFLVRILQEHPEFAGARIRMEKVKLHHGMVTDTGEYSHVQTRERMDRATPPTPATFQPKNPARTQPPEDPKGTPEEATP